MKLPSLLAETKSNKVPIYLNERSTTGDGIISVRPSVLSNLKDLLIKSLVRLVLKCNRSQSFAGVTTGDDPRNVKGIQKIYIGTDFRIFINI